MNNYARGEVETNTDSASDTTLSSTIWSKNHVEMRTWKEFDIVICNEVLELYTHDRAGYEPMPVVSNLWKREICNFLLPINISRECNRFLFAFHLPVRRTRVP